ncbi:MAG: polyprenyl synthetase family protein [Candidatus Bathyarchaeales archaeon]
MVKKIGKKIVADLKKRSEKGLELAKQIMQKEKIEDLTLREALTHYLTNWNDFTHPGLFSLACEAVGGHPDDVVSAQAATTMMAAAFDIHDDIIDKSETKHKIPTVYGKFGPETALLLGNAFLIEGFKLLVDSAKLLPKEKEKEALETVKRLTFEVGNAHAIEVSLKKQKSTVPDDYMKVIEMKAAGIELDMHLGALFGGGKNTEVETLAKLGRILGVLGTLREEFIDIFEIEELYQRVTTQDLPLPLSIAMQDQKTKRKVLNIISRPKITKNNINRLVDVVLEAEPVVKLKNKMQLLIKDGQSLTNTLPIAKLQSNLQLLLSFMLEDL